MATLDQILALIPEEYKTLRATVGVIYTHFSSEFAELTPERVTGWVEELQSGARRDEDTIRDNIFQYVVGAPLIMETLGVDEATAKQLILGKNDGGVNFSDLGVTATGTTKTTTTTTSPGDTKTITTETKEIEEKEDKGFGGKTADTVPMLRSSTLQWYFDRSTGRWYASYKLPNSDRRVFYEATGTELDAIFGEGQRPASYSQSTDMFNKLAKTQTFAGGIGEVQGTGTFESVVNQIIALALDEGQLPDWAKGDKAVMDLLYISVAENKGTDWLVEQITKLPSFKARFPQLDKIKALGLSTTEAVGTFLDYENHIKLLLARQGRPTTAVEPALVGALIAKGHSIEDIDYVFNGFEEMRKNQAALNAFNEVLVARGQEPLGVNEALDFVNGNAPSQLYDIWEEASFNRAARDAGLSISVNEAMDLARRTGGYSSYDQALEGLTLAAQNILRFRHEIALDKYGLDAEDLIDLSLRLKPRSGMSQGVIAQNMQRALQAARAGTDGPRAQRFRAYNEEGIPQAVSTTRSRTRS